MAAGLGVQSYSLVAQNWERDPGFVLPAIESAVVPESASIWVAALPDGRVLVAKANYLVNGAATASVFRLNFDGTVDRTFSAPAFVGFPRFVHVYSDGRLLIADSAVQLLRLLPNGAIDPSFAVTPLRTDFELKSAGTASGRIWIWGNTRLAGREANIALLKPDGGWDDDFQPSPDTPLSTIIDAAARPDGNLIVAGSKSLVQLNLNGTIDRTFDASATFPTSGPTSLSLSAVAVLADGKILAAHSSGISRLLPNGTRDATYRPAAGIERSFGGIGRVSTTGSIYYFTSGPNSTTQLNRLNADGTNDPAFKVQGEFTVMNSPDHPLMPSSWDERTFYFPNAVTAERKTRRHLVTRAGADGTLDGSFAPRFSTVAPLTTPVRQADGKYLVSGVFDFVDGTAYPTAQSNMIRLNANGSLDRSFRSPESTAAGLKITEILAFGQEPNGKILVATTAGRMRLNPDGSRDDTFTFPSTLATAVYAYGSYYSAGPNGQIARYSPEGARDPDFNPAAINNLSFFGIAVDGRVAVGASANGTSQTLIWLNRDGTVAATTVRSGPLAASSVLPDASVFFFEDIATGVAGVRAVRVSHFEAGAGQTLLGDFPNDLMSIAGIVRDVLAGTGGGDVALNLTNLRARGRVHLHGDEILLLPESSGTPGFRDAFPLARFRPKDSARPIVPRAPTFFTPAVNRTVSVGANVTLSAEAYGIYPRTYQWLRDGIPVGQATEVASGIGNTLVLRNVLPADAGDYTVRVTTSAGSATSPPTSLTVLVPPMIAQATPSVTVVLNQTVALTIGTTGENLRYTFTHDGLSHPGSGEEQSVDGGSYTLLLPRITAADAGVYRFTVSNGSAASVSTDIVVTLSDTDEVSRLANVSVRTLVGTGDETLIVGFVVGGVSAGPGLPILTRGIGPSLGTFGVQNLLADPLVTLRSGSTIVATNDNWAGNPLVTTAATQVGAFQLVDASSRDAALLAPNLPPGAYTLQVAGVSNSTGAALAEVYDATPPGASRIGTARLTNLSCRAQIGATGDALIAGFVVTGGTAKTFLIRAVGPSLAQLGIQGFLRSGQLEIFDGAGKKIAEHLGRGFDFVPVGIGAQVGAFPLASDANDNILVVTLPPGPYTAQLRGTNGSAGVALIEVYEVP